MLLPQKTFARDPCRADAPCHPAESNCEHCKIRQQMQAKYLAEAYELYSDFHIVKLPLKTEEVRGADKIKEFSKVGPRLLNVSSQSADLFS